MCVGDGAVAARNSNADSTDQIGHADVYAQREEIEAAPQSMVILSFIIYDFAAQFADHNDSDDDTVNGHSFAEDDTDQIFGGDSGRFD